MATGGRIGSPTLGRYKLSRRGRKLQMSDDQRTLVALPKDVPERSWADILQKEENDLMVLDIREEIIEDAMKICYEKYMARQKALFTGHCTAQAWLKLINWYFYRHDPGEDPSAYPLCYIPKRKESWIPDELPEPSPKDTWCKEKLTIMEDSQEEVLKKWPSNSSIDIPFVEDIPEEYWFPGKVHLPIGISESEGMTKTDYNVERRLLFVSLVEECKLVCQGRKRPLLAKEVSGVWVTVQEETSSASGASELLHVTDYSDVEVGEKESTFSALKTTTPVNGSLRGAGDSAADRLRPKRRLTEKSKLFSKSLLGRSKATLPPLDGDSRSRISIISDCRLRNLRLDTQYEITSEKIDTPPGELVKRK